VLSYFMLGRRCCEQNFMIYEHVLQLPYHPVNSVKTRKGRQMLTSVK